MKHCIKPLLIYRFMDFNMLIQKDITSKLIFLCVWKGNREWGREKAKEKIRHSTGNVFAVVKLSNFKVNWDRLKYHCL